MSIEPDRNRGIEGLRDKIMGLISGISNRYRDQSLIPDTPIIPTTIQLESKEHDPGVITLPGDSDAVVVFTGRAYLEHLSYLKDAATLFLHRNVKWDLDFCRALMDKGMGAKKLARGADLNDETIARIMERKEREVPSVFLFREVNAPEGQYWGISVQRKHFINTDLAGEVSLLDHVLRAFEPGYRKRKRGRIAVGLALVCHGGAMYYIHKTGNPVAAYTNTQSEHLVQESVHPWGELVISDPLMQEVREKSARLILLPGRKILPTGVIKGDYPEPNRGFSVSELRGGALDIYRKMTDPEQLGMRIDGENEDGKGYDSIAPLYRVK